MDKNEHNELLVKTSNMVNFIINNVSSINKDLQDKVIKAIEECVKSEGEKVVKVAINNKVSLDIRANSFGSIETVLHYECIHDYHICGDINEKSGLNISNGYLDYKAFRELMIYRFMRMACCWQCTTLSKIGATLDKDWTKIKQMNTYSQTPNYIIAFQDLEQRLYDAISKTGDD